jgi:hypothetical protein
MQGLGMLLKSLMTPFPPPVTSRPLFALVFQIVAEKADDPFSVFEEMTTMVGKSALRHASVRISAIIAVLAWFTLIAVVLVRTSPKERAGALCAVIAGWPVGYAVGLGMCWIAARFVRFVDESLIYGPAKGLQLKLLRGPMIWWINIVAVLYPLAVLVVGLVALVRGPAALGGN